MSNDDGYFERLTTYENFPVSVVVPVMKLVKAGFVYTGHGDYVLCKVCKLECGNWNQHDDPVKIHFWKSPNCAFIKSVPYEETLDIDEVRPSAGCSSNVQHFTENNVASSAKPYFSNRDTDTTQFSPLYREPLKEETYRKTCIAPATAFGVRYTEHTSLISNTPICQPSDDRYGNTNNVSRYHGKSSLFGNVPDQHHHLQNSAHTSIVNSQLFQSIPKIQPSDDRYGNANNVSMHHSESALFGNVPDQHNHLQNSAHTSIVNSQSVPPIQPSDDRYGNTNNVIRHQGESALFGNVPDQPHHLQNSTHTSIVNNQLFKSIPPIQSVINPRLQSQHYQHPSRFSTGNHSSHHFSHSNENGYTHRPNIQCDSVEIDENRLDYTIKDVRLQSFSGQWPEGHFITPEELADAGLYYTGPEDRVQCAWCRGGLSNWDEGDTPFGEHHRHFPECTFIVGKIAELINSGRSMRDIENEGHILGYGLDNDPPSDSNEDYNDQSNDSCDTERQQLINVAKDMGYSVLIINQALGNLSSRGSILTSQFLLDEIFQLEENESSESSTNNHSNQLQNDQFSNPQSVEYNHTNNSENGAFALSMREHTNNDENMMHRLVEENRQLKGATLCKVCMVNDVNIVFVSCGHLVCCEACSKKLTTCPFCRRKIDKKIKTYMP